MRFGVSKDQLEFYINKCGINPEKDKIGMTPLMHAAERGDMEICIFLSEKFSSDKSNAAEIAKNAGFPEISIFFNSQPKTFSEPLIPLRPPQLAALSISKAGSSRWASLAATAEPGVRVECLHASVDDDLLKRYFMTKGLPVKAAAVVTDPLTGLSKGFGYVAFENKQSVTSALREHGKTFMDNKLKVYVDDTLCH